MRIISPYHDAAHRYRGNVHCHSTESDGGLTPQETAQRYQEAGYDFLAITDHGRLTDTSGLSTQGFVCMGGEELSNPHMVALGIRETIEDHLDFAGQVRAVREQQGLAIVAHPAWMGLHVREIAEQPGLVGLEIYNHVCQLLNGKGTSLNIWDELLMDGYHLWGLAADDAHLTERHPQLGDAWIVVGADELTETGLLEAIWSGNFHSTCGPQIKSIQVQEDSIEVECSPCIEVRFVGAAYYGGVVRSEAGALLESAIYEPLPEMQYCRVECLDTKGRTAWSNPIRIEV